MCPSASFFNPRDNREQLSGKKKKFRREESGVHLLTACISTERGSGSEEAKTSFPLQESSSGSPSVLYSRAHTRLMPGADVLL